MRLDKWLASCAIAALASAAVATPASAVAAAPATCGAILTTDAYLSADLTCTGVGLTLDGDITLDLRGHTLTGTETKTAITVMTGRSVEVKSGGVHGWAYGVRLGGLFGPEVQGTVTVDDVTFSNNIYGVSGQDSQENVAAFVVSNSRFIGNRDGFHGDFSAPLRVSASSFSRNQTAVYVDTGSTISLTESRFEDNETGLRCFATVCKVLRSTFKRSTHAITSGDYGNVEVTSSTVTNNNVGYTAGYGTLTSNTFSNNNTGVVVIESGSVVATSNLFTGNGVGVTTVLTEGYTPRAELTNNTFLRNVDGVYVTLNPEDSDSAALLAGNIAVGNKRFGIYAPGATDQGNNRSTRNGESCVGVRCLEVLTWPRCPSTADAGALGRATESTLATAREISAGDQAGGQNSRTRAAAGIPMSCIPDQPGIPWRPETRIGRFPQ